MFLKFLSVGVTPIIPPTHHVPGADLKGGVV